MQHVQGIQTAFCSLLMKAWCWSVFLIRFICTHTKQTLAFSTISCYSWDLRSLWQQSPVLVCDGFCQSLCIGLLSATLYFPVSFQCLGVLCRCQPLLMPPEQACWLTFSHMVPCSFSHASNVTPGVSVPFFHFLTCPLSILVFIGFVSCGSLRPLKTDGVLEQLELQLAHAN